MMKSLGQLLLLMCMTSLSLAHGAKNSADVVEELDLDLHTKVSYLLAASKGAGKSSFGHAYLRFSGKKYSKNDPVVEFVADATPKQLGTISGYLRGAGLSLEDNYGMKVVFSNYKYAYKENVIKADRDLTSYELKLDDEQRETLINRINDMVKNGNDYKYSFFKVNCASVVSDTLNLNLEDKLQGLKSNIPNSLPKLLHERKLILSMHRDHRATVKRALIFDKYFPAEIFEQFDNPELLNLKEQFSSKFLGLRALAYYKLHYLKYTLPKQYGQSFLILGSHMLQYETATNKNEFIKFVNTGKLKFNKVELKRVRISQNRILKSYKLGHKNGKVIFSIKTAKKSKNKNDLRSSSTRVYAMPELTYSNGRILSGDIVLTREFNKEFSASSFYNSHFANFAEIIKEEGRSYISLFFIKEIDEIKYDSKLTSEDMISLQNGYTINKRALPMCYAVMELQSLMLTNVIFAPELNELSSERNLSFISDLHAGKIVVIPGFDNIKQFTSSLDQDELAKIVFKRQSERFNFSNLANDWFSDTKIDSDNIFILKNLLTIGIHPRVYFKVPFKGNIGHGVLVTNIKEDENSYYLDVIDPNKKKLQRTLSQEQFNRAIELAPKNNFQRRGFVINKENGKLTPYSYPKAAYQNTKEGRKEYRSVLDEQGEEFYGEVDLKLPKYNLGSYSAIQQVRHTQYLLKRARAAAMTAQKTAEKAGAYSFYAHQIMN